MVSLSRRALLAASAAGSLLAGAAARVKAQTFGNPDLPANLLTFSLAPGAPIGVTLKSEDGLLIWQTTDSDANTTNLITVRVTDNGTPALSRGRRSHG